MSEFLGARISLISKSDIRYSGVLHEINSEDSTVSLENVRSYGTEGRKGRAEEELPPSEQVYEYIVFRGSDVKDLRIEEGPAAKDSQPPAMPDDPAIVGARARPAAPGTAALGTNHLQGHPGPPGPPGFNPPSFQQRNFYPGPGGPWGRGGGPGPGPDPRFGGMGGMYPLPPNWIPPLPVGQGFPNAPTPWNQFGYPPGPHVPPGAPGQGLRGTAQQEVKPSPIGAGVTPSAAPGSDRPQPAGTPSQAELSAEPKCLGQPPIQPAFSSGPAPTPPVESKPSVEEVKASTQSFMMTNTPPKIAQQPKSIPTGPKSNRVTPAVPSFPGGVVSKQGTPQKPHVTATAATVKPAVSESSNGLSKEAAIIDATEQAREAVAIAMANMNAATRGGPAPPTNGTGNAMDNLTKKVNEMRVNAARTGSRSRGRGRGNRVGGSTKMDVPDADFDFQTSNAKFNKQELVKEAIAGSPLGEVPNGAPSESQETSDGAQPQAYNKTKSFFDNISSEAKDRAESGGQKPGGREWRGEEQRKNIETFGQGSVDGGYRSNYRGRGRGRGRGGPRGGRGYFATRGGQPRGDAQGAFQ